MMRFHVRRVVEFGGGSFTSPRDLRQPFESLREPALDEAGKGRGRLARSPSASPRLSGVGDLRTQTSGAGPLCWAV